MVADLRHVGGHDGVAGFRHAWRFIQRPLRAAANPEEADAERFGHFAQMVEMETRLRIRVEKRGKRAARKLELAAGLNGNGPVAGGFGKADNMGAVVDRLPANALAHPGKQGFDAALIGNGTVAIAIKHEFLVFRANAKTRRRLAAFFHVSGQLGSFGQRRIIGRVASHKTCLEWKTSP